MEFLARLRVNYACRIEGRRPGSVLYAYHIILCGIISYLVRCGAALLFRCVRLPRDVRMDAWVNGVLRNVRLNVPATSASGRSDDG